MITEPEAYFLPNAAVASLVSICSIDSSDSGSFFRKFSGESAESLTDGQLEELGLSIDGVVVPAVRSALESLAAADRIISLGYRTPMDGLAASILAGAGDQLVPVAIAAEGIFVGAPISVDVAIEQTLTTHLSSADRAMLVAGEANDAFAWDGAEFQVAAAFRAVAGGALEEGTRVSLKLLEAELAQAYAQVGKSEAQAHAQTSIQQSVERGLLREEGAELVVTGQIETEFRGVFGGSTLTVVSNRVGALSADSPSGKAVESLSGQLAILFSQKAAYRVLFEADLVRFEPCSEDELGVLLAIALSATFMPASLPSVREFKAENAGRAELSPEASFLDRFQLAATAANAVSSPTGSKPAVLYFPNRTMTLEIDRADNPLWVSLNADAEGTVSWTPFADGVVVTEISPDDGEEFLEELLSALEAKCGTTDAASEFWLDATEISEHDGGVAVTAGPLSQTDASQLMRFEFTCTALHGDGMIRGETFTGLAAEGVGMWVLDREEADSMLFVPADCDAIRSGLVRSWQP